MNKKKLKNLVALVRAEAKNLIKNSTPYERDKLEFADLNTRSSMYCVYGQMTGDCHNDRARELIVASCERVYRRINDANAGIVGNLNGKPTKEDRYRYWSPIEIFIDIPENKINGNNERLIKYLKGETKRLFIK